MNAKKAIVFASIIGAVGIAYSIYSLRYLSDAFEFELEEEEDLDGKV